MQKLQANYNPFEWEGDNKSNASFDVNKKLNESNDQSNFNKSANQSYQSLNHSVNSQFNASKKQKRC